MKVLGISPLDKDTTVSLLGEGGRIEYAIGEERLTRLKLQGGFPHLGLPHLFERCGIGPADIEAVTYPFYGWQDEARFMLNGLWREVTEGSLRLPEESHEALQEAIRTYDRTTAGADVVAGFEEFMQKTPIKRLWYKLAAGNPLSDQLTHLLAYSQWCWHAIRDHREFHQDLERGLAHYDLLDKLVRVEHHTAHCANAFYTSGFDRALILSIDAYGSGKTGRVSIGQRGHRIEHLADFDFPHSFGVYYEQLTSALGFKPSRHEGKILGLAAYGNPDVLRNVLRARFSQNGFGLRSAGACNYVFPRYLAAHFARTDVAAAHQAVMEEICQEIAARWIHITGAENVVLSGGVTANVKLNQRLHEVEGVKGVFIHPSMGDGGTGTGAALHYLEEKGAVERITLANAYLGPDYSEEQMREALEAAGLQYEKVDEVEEEIGRLISEGFVVARFNGRMEYGPRALGNRSILYHASYPEVNLWLNKNLGRTEFMPFAPATLDEYRDKCYRNVAGAEHTAQFMTITFDCTEFMLSTCPAAVHVDGTARPQLVSETSNPSFYRIISAYHRRTGVPSVINTSYNMHEEPIVCSPEDAIRAFEMGHLDVLAMGPFIVHGSADRSDRRPSRVVPGHAAVGA